MRPKIILNFIDDFPHEPSLRWKTSLKRKSCHGLIVIATRVAVYTIDQGTTNPVGVYPGGLAFLAKDAQSPSPRAKFFTQN